MVLFWVLILAAAVALLQAFEGWHTPLVFGLVGSGATVWRAAYVPNRVHRTRVVVTGGILTTSLVLWSWVDWRLVAVGGFCAALVLYPALHMVERRGDEETRSAQLCRLVRGIAIGAAITVFGLAVLGIAERNQASFAMRYGQRVTVAVGSMCTIDSVMGGPCPDATWTINGTTYTGTLVVGRFETAVRVPETYAYPGEPYAYSVRHSSANIDGMEALGLFPPWPVVLSLIMLVIGALPDRVRNRIRGLR
jgi:hypothetical protein